MQRGTAVTFGERLRELRSRAGLTQEELAERAGLTPHGVSALERGARTQPYPHTVRSLAEALGLDDDARGELFGLLPRRRGREVSSGTADESPAGTGTTADGPAPASAGDGLAVPATPLHGRERDLDAVVSLLRQGHRLVTLTGTGGVGKTRLAAEVARRMAPDVVDGVRLVPVAHLTETAQLPEAIGRALDLPGVEGPSAGDALRAHLRPLQVLLVLDNLEQLRDAGPAVAGLVEGCPDLRVLATSRVPLRVRSEVRYVVEPLDVPGGDVADLTTLAGTAAGAMFLERARASAPSVTLLDADAAPLAELCRRLAGIPLALELAAGHLSTLDARQLLDRLDLVLRREGATDLPERQRTLHAALEWSRELLSGDEQALLGRLTVFRGGFPLEGAEAVAGDPEAWSTLHRLVEHSLVQQTRSGGGQRFRILAPVAQWATSLLPAEELDEARRSHAVWARELAERAAPEYTRADQVRWLDRIDDEEPNLSAALDWAVGHDPALAGRLGYALWLHWWLRGRLEGGRRAMTVVLAGDLPDEVRVRAAMTHAALSFAQGDLAVARSSWETAARLAESIGDGEGLAGSRAGLGLVALGSGDFATAGTTLAAARDLARDTDGWMSVWVAGLADVWLGTVHLANGDPAGAETALGEALDGAERRGDRLTTYIALFNLAQVARATGDRAGARADLQHAARLSAETRDAANLAFVLDGLAVLEAADGECARVPLLVGGAEALRETVGGRIYGYYLPDEAEREAAVAAARTALGDDEYDDLLDRGRAWSFADAVAAAGPA